MKSVNGAIQLDDIERLCPGATHVEYVDTTGITVRIPHTVLARLYEVAKHNVESRGGDWDKHCYALFKTGGA